MKPAIYPLAGIAAMALWSATVNADTPVNLTAPHAHAANVRGKVVLFRAQTQGLELGPKEDFIDAEILVKLDTAPDKVFGIRLHEDNPAARQMIETLRQAYFHNQPVTLQHRLAPGRKNLKVMWVQLDQSDR